MSRWRPRTIRVRVAAATFILLTVILSSAGFVIDRFNAHASLSAMDDRLEAEAETLATLTHVRGAALEVDIEHEIIRSFTRPRSGRYFQITTSDGILERSPSLAGATIGKAPEGELVPVEPLHGRRTSVGTITGPHERKIRVYSLAVNRWQEPGASGHGEPDPSQPRMTVLVQVAHSMAEVSEIRFGEQTALLIGLGLALVLGTGGAFLVAGRATGPIRLLTHDARAIASGDPGRRLDAEATDGELRELVVLLNEGFERLSTMAERERRFAAGAAHELRTPIAICRARLELTLSRERTPEEYRSAIHASLDAVDRLEKLIEAFVLLARAEGPLASRMPLDLRECVEAACAEHDRTREPLPLRAEVPEDPVLVSGNPALVTRMVAELVANARRHGASPRGVSIGLQTDAGSAVLTVRDFGPGIAAEQMAQAFTRFSRSDRSRSRETGGAGLGLAIVKAIVDAHEGQIDLSAPEGGGTAVVVRLPLEEASAPAPAPDAHPPGRTSPHAPRTRSSS